MQWRYERPVSVDSMPSDLYECCGLFILVTPSVSKTALQVSYLKICILKNLFYFEEKL